MKRLLLLLLAFSAVIGTYAVGKFSVSSEKQVVFAPGNIQFHTGTQQWRFADNQYDVIGVDDNIRLGDPELSAWVDLFAWSCESSPYGVNPSNKDADYSGDFIDWGTQFEGGWYTPSKDELQYLLFGRNNASSLRAEGTVNGMNGLILLPDEWACPDNITFTPGYIGNEEYTENVYDLEQWGAMEAAGAVFLPHAGSRTGGYGNIWNGAAEATFVNEATGFYSWVDNVQVYGYYWSSTLKPTDSNIAYYLITPGLDGNLENYTAPAIWTREIRRGNSVRLVKELVPHDVIISGDIDNGSVVSDKETATMGDVVTLTISPDVDYQLDELIVESDDEQIDVTADFTFVMPDADVYVYATFKPNTFTGVKDLNIDIENVSRIQYVNAIGQMSDTPFKGINIVIIKLNDGTTRAIKAIK